MLVVVCVYQSSSGNLFLSKMQHREMLRSAEETAWLGKKRLHMMAPVPYSFINSCCEPVAVLGSAVLGSAVL